jgi:uncharacterized integral membrane protein
MMKWIAVNTVTAAACVIADKDLHWPAVVLMSMAFIAGNLNAILASRVRREERWRWQ